MLKQKVLVDILIRSKLSEKALSIIAEFTVFLLATNIFKICSETASDMIRDQVALWIKTKERIAAEYDSKKSR